MENSDDEVIQKTKVTIIAGFLGSGKTTMIERLIKQPSLKSKIAIIQNEFSQDMGIEAPLMTTADGDVLDEFYELPNGCI